MNTPAELILVCAVGREAHPLLRLADTHVPLQTAGFEAWRARFGRRTAIVAAGGMGYTNAAHALTSLLPGRAPATVVGFGIAGAPPDSPAAIGDLVVASSVSYGDVGVETETGGWIDAEGIGIPLGHSAGGPFHNAPPTDPRIATSLAACAAALEIRAHLGPIVSVSTGAGSPEAARRIAARYPALAEEMEGAALAHIAALHRSPFGLVRGISNRSGERNLSSWRIDEAAEAVARVLARYTAHTAAP